jgi:hypothetical protein
MLAFKLSPGLLSLHVKKQQLNCINIGRPLNTADRNPGCVAVTTAMMNKEQVGRMWREVI